MMVTAVPPEAGPKAGDTFVTTGGPAEGDPYVKPLPSAPACPSGFVTVTGCPPAVPEGVTAVSWVGDTNATVVAGAPPIVTVAPVWNADPVTVTAVPPEAGPNAGTTAVTTGGGAGAVDGTCWMTVFFSVQPAATIAASAITVEAIRPPRAKIGTALLEIHRRVRCM
ncbi:MAG: hypothetical protein L0216_07310 [Planctomycetales bacterium]|nr:hypothetical protein [Planctomycetales bacterium]